MQIDIPGYKIVSTLGQGGMATVYLALQTCFDREVALKIMSPNLSNDPSFGERFLREAQIVSRLMHPNIVTVYDVGIHDGMHYLAMEYLPGRDLKHMRFELSLLESLNVVKDIACALDYAGRKGYVHRDVKPENIMLHAEDGRAVLMDFGIARAADVASGMTQTGTAIGTPHYMSPEQAKGAVVDSRADLYSLGVVLFVLLAGHVPFDADSAVVVGIMHVSEAIPRLPPHLQIFQPIVDRVMAKDPDSRYQTGSELVADIESISREQILQVMKAMDDVLALDDGDQLSPTMVNPAPMHTGEQIVTHAHTVVSAIPAALNKLSGVDKTFNAKKAADFTQSSASNPSTLNSSTLKSASSGVTSAGLTPTPWNGQGETSIEVVSISAADRADHLQYLRTEEPEKKRSMAKLWVLVVVLGSLALFRDDLRGYWQTLNEPVTDSTKNLAAESASGISANNSSSLANPLAIAEAIPGLVPGIKEQARLLHGKLNIDLSVAPQITELYRKALAGDNTGDQEVARKGMEELQDFYTTRILKELEAGNPFLARQYADSARSALSENERGAALNDALQAGGTAMDVASLLVTAREYLDANTLDTPEGANALDTYRLVLLDDPTNAEALAGIREIAVRLMQKAEDEKIRGNLRAALSFTERGLALMPNDPALLGQQADLKLLREQQRQRDDELLDKARFQYQSGKIIAPKGDNAFESYRTLLAQDNENTAAQDGMAEIERGMVEDITDLIEQQMANEASTKIEQVRELFPRSQKLLTLKAQVEQLMESNIPQIARIVISNTEFDSIDSEQAETIAADRIIHIGFEYRNFGEETTVIQAILYDGARSLQIAQVPVIVSGRSGIQFFRIDQPVSGFAEGGYSIDLMLGITPLISSEFRVKK